MCGIGQALLRHRGVGQETPSGTQENPTRRTDTNICHKNGQILDKIQNKGHITTLRGTQNPSENNSNHPAQTEELLTGGWLEAVSRGPFPPLMGTTVQILSHKTLVTTFHTKKQYL